ncbi:uncharacterized protein FSUBG_3330 [Fusarium subglutinans]|uniref:C2H2-type domain-containing protein n=1 Tax=Gibberella subglutinans TaxID=42677 RepID=A0A8H5V5K6_GIBSU|nr:uncharacterized protein FSUBG_3330 [Fusarium subglutinans]KAF5610098.1 hypothetical protein FSUBG_3330 [Fusarium subglutinans]
MLGSTPDNGASTVESGPSAQPQYSSHNYPPPNSPPGVIQPNIPTYGPPPPVPQHQYSLPPSAPFAAHAYNPPAPFPVYEVGTAPAPRQRTSIACRYCRKRKIRCSGKANTPDERAPAFLPAPFAPGSVPPRGSTYGPLGEPYVQAQHQDLDVSISNYGSYPSLTHDYYHQHSVSSPPPPDYRGGYRDVPRPLYGQRPNHQDSLKSYAAPGNFSQGIIYSFSDSRASDRTELDGETLSDTESVVPINLDTTVDDYHVSETWKSQSSKHPEKTVETLQDRELQAPWAIPSLPHPRGLQPQSPAVSPEVLQDHDWKYPNLKQLKVSMTKLAQAANEPIKLPDPARLRISSPTPSSSPTVSSDIDVDSISADSEGKLDRNSQGYCVFSRVFSRLAILGQNEMTARGESSYNSSKGKQVAKGGSGSSSGTNNAASTRGGRKNRRQDGDLRDESRDRQNEPPKKKGKISQSHCDERSQFLACPYWKADSKRYWDCFLKKNDTIAHLKQHLTRRHTPKYYCQICYQTFKDYDLFDSHVLERSCTRSPSTKLEGISQQQKNQLSLKSKGSVEQQWYTVWSILFPEMEPPATIYIYSTQSEDFCRIQEFAQREGVAIMLEELESNGLVVRPNASNQLLQSTVQRAMVSIFRSYSVRGDQSSETEEPILSQALEPDNGVSLQQESTTEGQTSHDNHPSSSSDVNRMTEDGRGSSMVESFYRPSRSTESQLPTTTSWLPRVVQDDTEDELWGTAFLEEPAFGESSSGNDLPINFESTDMLDLDALLRDVISTEA